MKPRARPIRDGNQTETAPQGHIMHRRAWRCPVCLDHGLRLVHYRDGTDTEFAICRCQAAAWFRGKRGRWARALWCRQNQVDPTHLVLIEEVYDREELAALFPKDPLWRPMTKRSI